MATALWSRLHASRFDWAENSYRNFLYEIDNELAKDFEKKGEVTVILYGSTQVGKTTLLLNILGISREYIPEVSEILRGGSAIGNSATSTVMQYARSKDDYWRIMSQDSDPLGNQDVRDALIKIRKEVESGDYHSEKPLKLFIPLKYFSDVESKVTVRILDLPGINPGNKNEKKHVENIAARFIPAADLIFLVERADKLGGLKPNNLVFDELKLWPYTPERFRIILTYAYSLDDVAKWVSGQNKLTVESIRSKHISQMNTHGFHFPKEKSVLDILYPIEFGRSWSGLETSNFQAFEASRLLVDELFGSLQNDIINSANRYARIRSAFNLPYAIEANYEYEIRNIKICIEELNNAQNIQESLLRAHEHKIKNANKDLEKMASNIEIAKIERDEDLRLFSEKLSVKTSIDMDDGMKVSSIKQYITNSKTKINSAWKKLCSEVKTPDPSKVLDEPIQGQVDKAFRKIEKVLNDYSTDGYWFKNTFENDCQTAISSKQDLLEDLRLQGEAIVKRLYKNRLASLRRKEKRINDDIKSFIRAKNITGNQIKKFKKDMTLREIHLNEINRIKTKQMKMASGFNKHFEEDFHKELDIQVGLISSTKDPLEKFTRLCFAVAISDDFKKLGEGYG